MAIDYRTDTREDSLNRAEKDLYDLITGYRQANGLGAVALSKALTITAGRHALDTVYNVGSYAGHSWSDAPYDSANAATYPNMWSAPERVGTGYLGDGFEITFGLSGTAAATGSITPAQALAGWQSSRPHDDVILNRGVWAGIEFKAMGVAIHNGIAHVWFGREVDASGPPVIEGAPVPGRTITGDGTPETLLGTDGDDTIFGLGGDDVIQGGAGNDRLFGGDGRDTVSGGDGNDYIQADGGASSVLMGDAGNDTLYGGAGDDYLVGGEGDDVLVGLGGQDSLYGGAGNDYMVAGDGPGTVLDGGAGANSLWGAGGNDYAVGGEGNDIVATAGGSDYVFAQAGDNSIYAGNGTDFIFSGAGNDFIYTDDIGGRATDYVYVGGGTGVDTVADFTPGAGGDVLVVAKAATGLASFAAMAAATSQVGPYTVVTLGGGDQVYLYNVQPFQLTADNVLFL